MPLAPKQRSATVGAARAAWAAVAGGILLTVLLLNAAHGMRSGAHAARSANTALADGPATPGAPHRLQAAAALSRASRAGAAGTLPQQVPCECPPPQAARSDEAGSEGGGARVGPAEAASVDYLTRYVLRQPKLVSAWRSHDGGPMMVAP
jgi:hypothetical protein